MRMIDADALAQEMEEAKYTVNTSAYAKGCNDVLNYYIVRLRTAPTIDPVKHARWIFLPYIVLYKYKCSLCEKGSDLESNFCPSCGAKMLEVESGKK